MSLHKPVSDPWILVTNDDGVDSPAVPLLLRELSRIAPVRGVLPASECSWTGKIMSRFAALRPRRATAAENGAYEVWVVDGYPADCANLGIHTLFPTRPALVVSGINLGTNAGLAYLLSSGTVGAAVEGMLGGIPAAAFSVHLNAVDYDRWRRDRVATPQVLALLGHAAVVTREIVEELLDRGMPGDASVLTVNMPSTTKPATPRRLARVTRTEYGAYFVPSASGRYEYGFSGVRVTEPIVDGDLAALERGEVTLSPLRFVLDATVTEADRSRFERVEQADAHAGGRLSRENEPVARK